MKIPKTIHVMQNLKYLLLIFLTFHFSLEIQAQDQQGYVVLLEGDTLMGNVKISRTKPVKFYQNDEKTVYTKEELLDYGYYRDGKYISRPERIPPSGKATLADIVMATGDTLYGCYVKKCDTDFLEAYIEYPTKKIFPVTEGKVKEVILYQDSFTIHIDAIHLMHNEKKGNFYPGYAVRSIDGQLRRYNGRMPFSKITTLGALGILLNNSLEEIGLDLTINAVIKANIDKWIVYKDGKSYRFNNFKQWESVRPLMFADDEGFNEYLKEKKYNELSIDTVLHAYNIYWEEKYGN